MIPIMKNLKSLTVEIKDATENSNFTTCIEENHTFVKHIIIYMLCDTTSIDFVTYIIIFIL